MESPEVPVVAKMPLGRNRPRIPRFRTSLRGLFLFSLSIFIAFVLGASPVETDEYWPASEVLDRLFHAHYGLLGLATTPLIAALTRDALTIRRFARNQHVGDAGLLLACRVAVMGRLATVACLLIALAARIVDARQVVDLPSSHGFFYSDPVTGFVWWFAIIIAMNLVAAPQVTRRTQGWSHKITSPLVIAGAVIIGLYMIFQMGMVTFLVHLACAGVDAGLENAEHRYPVTSGASRHFSACLSAASVAALIVAAGALVRAFRPGGHRPTASPAWLALGGLALASCCAFVGWFEWRYFPMVSPDLAEAGSGSTWWHRLGGLLLAAMLTSCIAIRAGVSPATDSLRIAVRRSRLQEALIGVTLVLAMNVQVFRLSDVMDYGWDGIDYLFELPEAYLAGAVVIVATRTIWLAWRRGHSGRTFELQSIDQRRLLSGGAAAASWLGIATFTLAAAQMLFWQGSWYEW